jgi:hypothetical protein
MFTPTNPFYQLEEPVFRALCQAKALTLLCRRACDGIDPDAAAGLELIFESLTQDLEELKACVAQHISAA